MSELDTPPVTTEERLVPGRPAAGASMLDRWVNSDPDGAIKRIETMVRVLEQLRSASIRATYPSDWIIHVSRDKDGNIIAQRGYLQDIGAERAGKPWGIEVGNPAIEEKQYADGTFAVYMLAEAWSKVTGERLDYVEGSRWSGDRFFSKSVGPDEKIDPTDVRKSAYANLHGRAVRSLSGLNGVPVDVLRTAGLDVSKVIVVDYEKGAKGGESAGASVGTTDLTMPWGNAKGTKVTELAEKDLTYYLGAYERDVADPKKAQYQKANQRMLDALRAEKERRARAAEQAGPPTPGDDSAAGDDGGEPTRGRMLGDLHARLSGVAKGDGKRQAALLRALTRDLFGKEIAALSELTDEQLRRCCEVPEDVLSAMATHPAGPAAGKP
jgi:hypothetical protein